VRSFFSSSSFSLRQSISSVKALGLAGSVPLCGNYSFSLLGQCEIFVAVNLFRGIDRIGLESAFLVLNSMFLFFGFRKYTAGMVNFAQIF
jgi:hypothetical protein